MPAILTTWCLILAKESPEMGFWRLRQNVHLCWMQSNMTAKELISTETILGCTCEKYLISLIWAIQWFLIGYLSMAGVSKTAYYLVSWIPTKGLFFIPNIMWDQISIRQGLRKGMSTVVLGFSELQVYTCMEQINGCVELSLMMRSKHTHIELIETG